MPLKPEYTDKEIINLLKSSLSRENNTGFKEIHKKSYGVISKLVLLNNGTKEEAEDVYHDTVIIFYEKVKSGKLTLTCSITTYLYSIARNLWLKRLSKIKNLSFNLNDTADFIQVNDATVYDEALVNRVSEIFETLNAPCKTILMLFYFENMPMKEIMKRMNLKSEQSAKNKKYKCLQYLKELVNKKIPLNEA